ncbi:hypothetical protein GCM10011391_12130 [Pullulanibacillus camelliae]|uniref:FTR1 family iron permease n=1 Tax=Pullulanibacillus camelliae TaxID=1707096 RepID=A0A8J2VPT5_9BACL|nr:FTR1 family protein [Pullulanibacillus camelliae]GGE35011.1 hypothetical protein GCM10011391_12130 [Pullulanibacillus camelliae]
MRRSFGLLIFISLVFFGFSNPIVQAKADKVKLANALTLVNHVTDDLKAKQTVQAKQDFDQFKAWWLQNKNTVRKMSLDAYMAIDQDVGTLSLDLLNDEGDQALSDSQGLKKDIQDFKDNPNPNSKKKESLSTYIEELKQTKTLLQNKEWTQAQAKIKTLQSNWLTVEGDVVSQSQTVYTKSEEDLVLLDAYVASPSERHKTLDLINEMIFSLQPLADSDYNMWVAALIPIREGLEALLVVGALLTFSKKAESKEATRWVWGGSISGILVCMVVGGIVTFLLSSQAFGNNNSLINGYSGVIASVMLLYVSYWLHRNADIKRWNQFIRSHTEKAMTSGRMLSFAIIAFLAILREGMETVIFLIGMANRMPVSQLVLGIVVGFGVLVIIGVLMLKIGIKLPLKPFFLISSFIVFYLCFKFMGSGIHSLQMAGVLPSTVPGYLPSVNALSIFPSWYSTLPQLVFLIIAIVIVLVNQLKKYKGSHQHNQEAM